MTADACFNDNTALRLQGRLRHEGRDIVITGYGNLLPHYSRARGLTTVAQPFQKRNCAVSGLLLARLGKTERLPASFQQIDRPVRLIVRDTAVPAEKDLL